MLQSEGSRLAEWVRSRPDFPDAPYPVMEAVFGVEHAAAEWTEIRRATPQTEH